MLCVPRTVPLVLPLRATSPHASVSVAGPQFFLFLLTMSHLIRRASVSWMALLRWGVRRGTCAMSLLMVRSFNMILLLLLSWRLQNSCCLQLRSFSPNEFTKLRSGVLPLV